jgi:hypothetical protein
VRVCCLWSCIPLNARPLPLKGVLRLSPLNDLVTTSLSELSTESISGSWFGRPAMGLVLVLLIWVRGSASVAGCLATVVVVSLTMSAVGQSQSCIVVCRWAGRALDCGRCRGHGRRFCSLEGVPLVGLPLSVGGSSWRGVCRGYSDGGVFLPFLSCCCRWLGELVGSSRT